MQLSGFEAVLTFTLVEEVRLEFPTGVFFCGRHYIFLLAFSSPRDTLDDFEPTVGVVIPLLYVFYPDIQKAPARKCIFEQNKKNPNNQKVPPGVDFARERLSNQTLLPFNGIQLLRPIELLAAIQPAFSSSPSLDECFSVHGLRPQKRRGGVGGERWLISC